MSSGLVSIYMFCVCVCMCFPELKVTLCHRENIELVQGTRHVIRCLLQVTRLP